MTRYNPNVGRQWRGEPDGWHTIVRFGHCSCYRMPPRGPYPCKRAALDALARWRESVGCIAGTIEAAHSVRLAGPFVTRAEARKADISGEE